MATDHPATTPVPADIALAWNANAVGAVLAATTTNGLTPDLIALGFRRPLYQVEGSIYMSYVQAAVYDAVTKIAHRYKPYHHFHAKKARKASVQAATISAAYNTLTFYLGDPGGVLAAKYAASIAALPAGDETTTGIAVGLAAAEDIEQLRADDGRNADTPVFGAPGPVTAGAWQVVLPAPATLAARPWLRFAQTPWVATLEPFMLKKPSQFRAPPPPALTSAQYAADFNETKTMGAAVGSARTASQTAIALFWNANAVNQENTLYRDVAVQHGLDLVDTVRLLAMGDLTASDAGIACFDSKYHYLHWRPATAIQNAGIDGNPATTADPAWTPLIGTPNHPEYPSAHGCVTSSVTRVIAGVLGTDAINVTIKGATLGGTALTTSQTFGTVQQLQDQLLDARVWAGLHWRNSDVTGENLGNALAAWVLQHNFQPVGKDEGDDDD